MGKRVTRKKPAKKPGKKQVKKDSETQQYEDAVLKASMQFFADELLPYLGVGGKVVSFAPTELVHLDLHKLYQDFLFVMEDGSWKHFEFQSTNEGLNGLKRFRVYEALTSYQYKKEVFTYVLFSGKIKKPMTRFTEGNNTYQVIPIIMQDKDGDSLLAELEKKLREGRPVTKDDLVPLTLCPLMGGKLSQKERIKEAFSVLQKADKGEDETVQKIEAMLYAMAEKFLKEAELQEVKERIKMTRLGQMLVDDGRKEGREEGRREGREEGRREGKEEGRKEERVNTERERRRANAAERENRRLREELRELQKLKKEIQELRKVHRTSTTS